MGIRVSHCLRYICAWLLAEGSHLSSACRSLVDLSWNQKGAFGRFFPVCHFCRLSRFPVVWTCSGVLCWLDSPERICLRVAVIIVIIIICVDYHAWEASEPVMVLCWVQLFSFPVISGFKLVKNQQPKCWTRAPWWSSRAFVGRWCSWRWPTTSTGKWRVGETRLGETRVKTWFIKLSNQSADHYVLSSSVSNRQQEFSAISVRVEPAVWDSWWKCSLADAERLFC